MRRKESRKVTSDITRPCFSPQMSWLCLKAGGEPHSLSDLPGIFSLCPAPTPEGRKHLSDTLEQQGTRSVGCWVLFSFVATPSFWSWCHLPSEGRALMLSRLFQYFQTSQGCFNLSSSLVLKWINGTRSGPESGLHHSLECRSWRRSI